MWNCQACRETVQPHTKLQLVVTETREKVYPVRPGAQPYHKRSIFAEGASKKKLTYKDDPGGVGREIVKEKRLCDKCVIFNEVKHAEGPRQ